MDGDQKEYFPHKKKKKKKNIIQGRDSLNNFCRFSFLGYPKRTTSFLVVPKKPTRNDACLVSDLKNTRPGMTRNDQKWTN